MPDSVATSLRLAPDALTRPFSAEQFSFSNTNDLEPFRGILGQERAVEALQFGVAMPRPGYNVYVMGEPGTIVGPITTGPAAGVPLVINDQQMTECVAIIRDTLLSFA